MSDHKPPFISPNRIQRLRTSGGSNVIGEAVALIIEELDEIRQSIGSVENATTGTNRFLLSHDPQSLHGLLFSIEHHLAVDAADRIKQRRYMRFNLVQEIDDWERRAVEDDDTSHAEGMLLRLRAELEMLDDLWPDTAAVALTAVRR